MDRYYSLIVNVRELFAALAPQKATIATAESCTGGLLATLLSEIEGSSAFYLGGVAAYSNDVKRALLDVPDDALNRWGAVSEPVAKAMAAGIRIKVGATFGVSLTGIAGPGGGTPEKPVGTVWCGLASEGRADAILLHLVGDRRAIREDAAALALRHLLDYSRPPRQD